MFRVNSLLEDGMAIAKAKMVIHKDKGSWEFKSREQLMKELRREVEELNQAKTREETILECGDIINYACMIIEEARRRS